MTAHSFRADAARPVTWMRGALPLALAALAACGQQAQSPTGAAAPAATSVSLQLDTGDVVPGLAQPSFHAAPVELDAPGPDLALGVATPLPHQQAVPAETAGLSSRRLTWQVLEEARRTGGARTELTAAAYADDAGAAPFASGSVVSTYTPAQVRAAYGLQALPAPGAAVASGDAALLGAGQTIYIVDAQHDPNAYAELAQFNAKFGVPGCTSVALPASQPLPLPAAGTGGCTFSVAYTTASGQRTDTAPAYDSGWATEIALDVQWAHAIAPYARLVLIEAPDASVNSLAAAVQLANAMGPGIVSMSFGAPEGNWTPVFDATFATPGMSYLAAAGDSGAATEWPAVASSVVAVGGTSLTWTGSGRRSEVAWSGTGGGISGWVALPSWQSVQVPGVGKPAHRAVTDVSFNADPSTGQYLAVQPQGSASVQWMSAGGTSLATPQWAGLLAIANAQRARAALAPLGAPHARLYALAATASSYAAAFGDVSQGNDGTCASCVAAAGYDLPTGLGTPNGSALVGALAGTAPSGTPAPVVAGGQVSGTAGVALSFSVAVASPDPIAYSLAGAPSGMVVNAAGIASWATPVAGTYTVLVTAVDTATGLSGQGTYTVAIAAPKAPVVAGGKVSGYVATPLSFTVSVQSTAPLAYSLAGAPAGMSISAAGLVSWAAPTAGNWTVTVTARDTVTGLSGKGSYAVTIGPAPAPVVGGGSWSGVAGKAMALTVPVTSVNPVTWALSGAPGGMAISASGVISWASPVAGSYAITVRATDTRTGLAGSGQWTVVIAKAGPVITATAMKGKVGQPFSGSIGFSDATSNQLSVTISGIPSGMAVAVAGSGVQLTWAAPVAGNYTLTVSAKDGNGLSATLAVPVSIAK